MTTSTRAIDVIELIAERAIRAVYQPIVELETRAVVGWEALARGPAGTELEAPTDLFEAAATVNATAELDRVCRAAAVEGVVPAELGERLLFVNVEPLALDGREPFDDALQRKVERLGLVAELTERSLIARPSEVLAAVRWLRERGCRIALDDVGGDERSLALMPFVEPDVIKLDMRLVQERATSVAAARVIHAVGAEAERSGAVVLAEGIETEQHLVRAMALGATLGQGWLFGRPGPRASAPDAGTATVLRARSTSSSQAGTPFDRIADECPIRRGEKRMLLALSRHLERGAWPLGGEVVVLAAFQDVRFFTDATRRTYEVLARRAALVGAVGVGLPERPGHGVRGASLAPDDPLREEWDVIVVSPHFAAAFVARDLGDKTTDADRRFDYVLTYDRALVTHAAQPLLERLLPVL